jgi:antitoxin ParD1/3/4
MHVQDGGNQVEHVVSLELDDESEAIMTRLLESGRYADAEQVLLAGMALLEEHDARVQKLRSSLIEGEQSGQLTPWDVEARLSEKRVQRSQ